MPMVMESLRFQRQLFVVAKTHEAGMARGLKKAGLFLQREAQILTPVDTGALRNSARTEAEGKGRHTVVRVVFTTAYAIFVHERLDLNHPIGQAKFLEEPARLKRNEMTLIVWREARIGNRTGIGKV